ncbi:transposase [Arthrobacter sp. UYCu712]|uniref:transposase n=1 Tax=Arthrobacter sp. UYCu712 TaxID=3156340 RepID=UPI003394FDC8
MPKQFPPKIRDRAVRMTVDRLSEYPSVYAACKALAPKLGVGPESLRRWVVQAQIDAGEKTGPSSDELEEIKRLRAEVRDLKESNEILKQASIFFARELDLAAADLSVHRRNARCWLCGRVDLRRPAGAGRAGRRTNLPGVEKAPAGPAHHRRRTHYGRAPRLESP